MRSLTSYTLLVLTAVLLTPLQFNMPPAMANDAAAHALAERFAGGADNQTSGNNGGSGEEAEILERARNEATAREAEAKKLETERAAEAQRLIALQRQAELTKAAAQEQLAREVSGRIAAERQAVEKKAAENKAKQEAQKAAEAAERAATAEAQRTREREVSDLAEKLKRVRDARPSMSPALTPDQTKSQTDTQSETQSESLNPAMGLGVPPQAEAAQDGETPAIPLGLSESEPVADAKSGLANLYGRQPNLPRDSIRNATSVTVLLVMEPGTTGIRRGSKTADPVLCLDTWCYISTGTAAPAKLMSRGATFGPINTLGLRAGACRQSLTCIYRGLDIAAYFKTGARPANLQPVDLRYLHHDRRQAMPLTVDSDCSASGDQIVCTKAIKGKDWTAWIIPEELAVKAGVGALQAALDSGLSGDNAATRAAVLKSGR